ncbi:MAG: hypothetical protein ABUT20_32580, partial [Bacteroidota bacterium]
QPTAQPTIIAASPATGVFGTMIPSTVAFAVGILLFFLPFIDIKCNNMTLQQVSGVELATGFKIKKDKPGNSFIDNTTKNIDEGINKSEKKDPNIFAMVALGLGVLGLLLSFTKARAGIGLSMFTGILATVALIGLMIDVKRKAKIETPDMGGKNSEDDFLGLNKIGQQVSDSVHISVDFTPWFYVAVIAFIAGAFFSYKRMQAIQ